jgi:hypothetical protein
MGPRKYHDEALEGMGWTDLCGEPSPAFFGGTTCQYWQMVFHDFVESKISLKGNWRRKQYLSYQPKQVRQYLG